ncbi:MAG: GH3 auxin-responsive promoter family protein [Cytophagaceae bacterium]|nr:GH3 auxin-responsive promoter family protein [Cytophagaceae bacterium]
MALTIPKVHYVKHGTFYQWMEKRGKLGGQNKVPRLIRENYRRHYLSDFNRIENITMKAIVAGGSGLVGSELLRVL